MCPLTYTDPHGSRREDILGKSARENQPVSSVGLASRLKRKPKARRVIVLRRRFKDEVVVGDESS
ncbi:MAG: hypothetical protein KF682_09105 [Nitrospira sp.]|nr:hypothetical protein [Nitrospira sp.]